MTQAVYRTEIPGLPEPKRGKVRDMYDLGDRLLMVASDRISAFDVILPDPVPDKGKVLTQISLFWFDVMKPLVDNHVITSDVAGFPDPCQARANQLAGRSILVKKCEALPVECVVRGYLSGSGWKDYQKTQSVCGIGLPPGLKESDKLPEVLFTPSTKAEQGLHDENISFDQAADLIGRDLAEKVRDLSIEIYQRGAELAGKRGIIIADTKFEFGLADGKIVLIDEVLTPDSSRFWPKESYEPGKAVPSFDKQYVRDYLLSLDWDKKPPAPNLPADVIENTRQKYVQALTVLTGSDHGL